MRDRMHCEGPPKRNRTGFLLVKAVCTVEEGCLNWRGDSSSSRWDDRQADKQKRRLPYGAIVEPRRSATMPHRKYWTAFFHLSCPLHNVTQKELREIAQRSTCLASAFYSLWGNEPFFFFNNASYSLCWPSKLQLRAYVRNFSNK
jgi:hypothetical protein